MKQMPWIKLYAKIKEWTWYKEPYTRCVFEHLLLSCEQKPWTRAGVWYPAGSLVTNDCNLGYELGMDRRTVRKCLENLKATGEITESARRGDWKLIVVVNWANYQPTNGNTLINSCASNVHSDVQCDVQSHVQRDVHSDVQCDAQRPMPININKENIKNMENKREGEREAPPPPAAPLASIPFHPPNDADGVRMVMDAATVAGMAATESDAEKFLAYYEGQGWRKANGMAVTEWRAVLKTWMIKEKEIRDDRRKDDFARGRTVRGTGYTSPDVTGFDGNPTAG